MGLLLLLAAGCMSIFLGSSGEGPKSSETWKGRGVAATIRLCDLDVVATTTACLLFALPCEKKTRQEQ